MARVERFGERRQYPRGERLFAAVDRTPGMFVVLKGALTMTAPDGLGRMAQAVRHGPGQFTGEVAQLSTGVAVVDADADDDLEALLIPPDRLHALIVAEAEMGEQIVRALILRRVAHIESGGSGPMLIGDPQSPDMLRLENFLRRNGQAHHAVDPSQDKAAALLLRRGRPGCTGRVSVAGVCDSAPDSVFSIA
jgi:thioredoxin reductase (NADPH)